MAYNTIVVFAHSSTPLVVGPASDEEQPDEIIYPGSLCHIKRGEVLGVPTDGSVHTCGQVGGAISPMLIALEDLDNGHGIGVAYNPGEMVPLRHFRPGDLCLVRFKQTGAYDQGQKLKATGTTLGTFTNTTLWGDAMCYAQEAIEAGAASRLIVAAVK
jgi:hypothetical protein